jgi:DNA topoisomerase I
MCGFRQIPVGHIQATGFDRGERKQYRYHTAWRDLRDRERFDAIVSFGETLRLVREAVAADLSSDGLEHKRVLGCAARLLDLGSFGIGSDRYAVDDDTHGLTTLLAREIQLDGEVISFRYVGKEYICQVQHFVDPDARRVVAQLLDRRDPINGCSLLSTASTGLSSMPAERGPVRRLAAPPDRTWRRCVWS